MTQYDYKIVDLYPADRLELLKPLGEDGWQYCGEAPGHKYAGIFKRTKAAAVACGDLRGVQCCDPIIDSGIGRANERLLELERKLETSETRIRELEQRPDLSQARIRELEQKLYEETARRRWAQVGEEQGRVLEAKLQATEAVVKNLESLLRAKDQTIADLDFALRAKDKQVRHLADALHAERCEKCGTIYTCDCGAK